MDLTRTKRACTFLNGLLGDRCLLCGRLLVLEKVELGSKSSFGISIQASRGSLGLDKGFQLYRWKVRE
jgi:hypothetical protein